MTHIHQEELVLHYYGEDAGSSEAVERHLIECPDCRASYNSLRLVLNSVDAAPVPERSPDYGSRVWQQVAPKIGSRRRWTAFLQPRWWALAQAAAALMLAAFLAGRFTQPASKPGLAGNPVRERILLVAVGDHLDRSQMVLAELSNAPDGKGKVDISGERQLAEDLLDNNRLYRQTARSTGDTAVASVLDDLERVLLEVAHSPSEVSKDQFDRLRQQIEERGLLFKVRVVGSQVRERENASMRQSKLGARL